MKLLYPLAKRFIAGYNLESAKPAINKLLDQGFGVTIDYVGEMSKTLEDVQNAYSEYTKILNSYKNVDISIKPSQIGLLMDSPNGKTLCMTVLDRLVNHARYRGNTIRLDMEDSRVTKDTVDLAVKYNVGCAIQSNHPDTLTHMHNLITHNIPIRLVKGAYKEKITDVKDIRDYFLLYADIEGDITIATHDEILLNQLTHHNKYEFLYGIRRDLQKKLKSKGKDVTIYVPYGENWLPYTIRRLKESKNLKFVIGNMIKERLNNFML